jgi:hypothetical protein
MRLQCTTLMLDERVPPAGQCPIDEDSFAAPLAELRLKRSRMQSLDLAARILFGFL